MTAHFPGFVVKSFKAVCPITGWTVMRAYSRATARNAADFLHHLQRDAPFKILSVQVDRGSEFMGEFEQTCHQRGIEHYVLKPRSPKYNGCVERANGTVRTEFYNTYRGPLTIAAINRELVAYQRHYNHYRPHDGIDLETPMAYYEQLAQAA